jgi:hypothetical protein
MTYYCSKGPRKMLGRLSIGSKSNSCDGAPAEGRGKEEDGASAVTDRPSQTAEAAAAAGRSHNRILIVVPLPRAVRSVAPAISDAVP